MKKAWHGARQQLWFLLWVSIFVGKLPQQHGLSVIQGMLTCGALEISGDFQYEKVDGQIPFGCVFGCVSVLGCAFGGCVFGCAFGCAFGFALACAFAYAFVFGLPFGFPKIHISDF